MAELFDVEVNTINYHLKEIFKSGELGEKSVLRKIRITVDDSKEHLNNIYDEEELEKESTISILEIVQNEGTYKIFKLMFAEYLKYFYIGSAISMVSESGLFSSIAITQRPM